MKRIQFSLLLIFTLLFAGSQSAFACGCIHPRRETPLNKMIADELNKSGAVFSGKVTEIIRTWNNPLIEIKFKVDILWKGESGGEISLFEEKRPSSCDFNFKIGESYLVYAKGKPALLYTNVCSRTTKFANAEQDIEILSKGKRIPIRETRDN